MKQLTIILIAIACCARITRATPPVLSVDTDRIVSLARQGIADSKDDVDSNKIEFTDITYRFDAERKEHLRVTFRYSPESESETTEDGDRHLTRTTTEYRSLIVDMDKTGKVLSIDAGGKFSQTKFESRRTNKVLRAHPSAIAAIKAVAHRHGITYETMIHSAIKVEMEFTIAATGAEKRVMSIKQDLKDMLSEKGWEIVVSENRTVEGDETKTFVGILIQPKK